MAYDSITGLFVAVTFHPADSRTIHAVNFRISPVNCPVIGHP